MGSAKLFDDSKHNVKGTGGGLEEHFMNVSPEQKDIFLNVLCNFLMCDFK